MNEYYLEPQYDMRKSFYKKARVVEDGNKATLYSYNTRVCEINFTEEEKVNIFGFYSQTTTRHIKDFIYQAGYAIGDKQFLYENYTSTGREEAAKKEEARLLREQKRAEKEQKRAEIEERKAQRLLARKEKLRKKISKELGSAFSEEEIETLVLQEL